MNGDRAARTVWDWRAGAAAGAAAGAPTPGTVLRRSAWPFGAAVILLLLRRPVLAGVAAAAGAILLALGLAAPRAWAAADRLSARLGSAVGRALAYLLLLPMFWLVVVPGGLWLRLRRRDPLHRSFREPGLSYWIRRRLRPDPAQYERQFLVEDRAARSERRPLAGEQPGARP